jgi:Family of unknown function (DUF5681)
MSEHRNTGEEQMSENMHDDLEQEDGEVGYCKPPKHPQFKKGVSGNPSGRPKKALHFGAQVMRQLKSTLTINENGKRRVITKDDAVALQLVNKAASGNLQAARLVIELRGQELARRAEDDKRALDLAGRPIGEFFGELTDAQLLYIATCGGTKIPPLDWRPTCPTCSKIIDPVTI